LSFRDGLWDRQEGLPGAGLAGQNLMDHFAVVDGEALAVGELEAVGIESEEVEDGGVDIGDVVGMLDGVETDFIGGAVGGAAADAGAGEPGAEAGRVVIASVAFGSWGAAKFCAADDGGF